MKNSGLKYHETAQPSQRGTRMTQIARIFTDPRASASSAQSAFYCNPSVYDYKSHPYLNLLENKPQMNADERRFVERVSAFNGCFYFMRDH